MITNLVKSEAKYKYFFGHPQNPLIESRR